MIGFRRSGDKPSPKHREAVDTLDRVDRCIEKLLAVAEAQHEVREGIRVGSTVTVDEVGKFFKVSAEKRKRLEAAVTLRLVPSLVETLPQPEC